MESNKLVKVQSKSKVWSTLRKHSAWLASMMACTSFLLMALNIYEMPIAKLLDNLIMILLVALTIVCLGLAAGWVLVYLRKRK